MPLITLTPEERQELTYLLEVLDAVCSDMTEHPSRELPDWKDLQARIQSLRLRLFEEE